MAGEIDGMSLLEWRRFMGWSVQRVADELTIGPETFSRYEKGKAAPPKCVILACRFLLSEEKERRQNPERGLLMNKYRHILGLFFKDNIPKGREAFTMREIVAYIAKVFRTEPLAEIEEGVNEFVKSGTVTAVYPEAPVRGRPALPLYTIPNASNYRVRR